MLSRLLAGALVATAACSSSSGHAPTSAEVTPPSASSSMVSGVDFSCRLPVLIYNKPPYGWTGGFITFPARTFESDQAGVINSVGDGELDTQAKPVLRAYTISWPFYNLARKRWLPVGPGQTSADGSAYAYAAPSFGGTDEPIIIVTVATGAGHQLDINLPPQGAGQNWQVGDYDGRYVYLVATQVDQFPAGVWRLDSVSGTLTNLLPKSAGHVLLLQNGVAWVGLTNPADPSPPSPPKGEAFDTIASINLSTGAQTTWIYRPGKSVILWGLDSSSHPVVMVTAGPDFGPVPQLILVDAPASDGIAIPAGSLSQRPAGFLPFMEADAGRLWFGAPDGIYYWTLATGLHRVYEFKPDPASNASLQELLVPAGHCV
jgi:hypothetical protein